MFKFTLEHKEDYFSFEGCNLLEKISFDLIINLDVLEDPLARISFAHPPRRRLAEYNWVDLRQALLKKEMYCLELDNNCGVILLEVVPEGVVFRTLINYQELETSDDPNITRAHLNEHDGCHLYIPLNEYRRQALVKIIDEIIELCQKFEES